MIRGLQDTLGSGSAALTAVFAIAILGCSPAKQPTVKKSSGGASFEEANVINAGPQGQNAPGDKLDTLKQRVPRTCKQAEDNDQIVEFEKKFTIPAQTTGCAYGQNGNLSTTRITRLADGTTERANAEGFVRARHEHNEVIELPSKLCETSVEINQPNFEYRDNLVIALNNKVLMSTAGQIIARLPQKTTRTIEGEQPLRLWSWFNAADTQIDVDDDPRPYCVFYGAQNCEAPGPEGSGGRGLFGFFGGGGNNNNDTSSPLRLQMSEEELSDLITDRRHKRSVRFSMITLGDSDANDCTRSAVDVTMKFKLMPASANDDEEDEDGENQNDN